MLPDTTNPLKPELPNLRTPLTQPYISMYGADHIAARYCGLKQPPCKSRGLWQHGVVTEEDTLIQVDQIFGVTMSHLREGEYLVATKYLEDFMRHKGFAKTRAIGMPIVYARRTEERRKETLLVMPAHSNASTSHNWQPRYYVEQIAKLKSQFKEIVVCVHEHCWTNGWWVPEFEGAGFKVIRGAGGKDPWTLQRMAGLFQQFDCVTTNSYGSHLAYAAHFGARISIFGPYIEVDPKALVNIPFYIDNPNLLGLNRLGKEEEVRKSYPDFFCNPAEALSHEAWGRKSVGADCKLSPAAMRELFGWTLVDRLKLRGRRLRGEASATAKTATPEAEELKRIKKIPRYTPGRATLFGGKMEYTDSLAYVKMHEELFKRQLYRFTARNEQPLIIDAGSNIGMSVLYFKCLYPDSKIIAFEPDPEIFQLLSRNCKAYGLEGVQLLQKAVWKCDTTLAFQQEGSLAGRLTSCSDGSKTVEVPACRLRDYLAQHIDLLKIDIEGAETEVLEDCADLLGNADHLIVEHHSFADKPQDLNRAINLIQDQGFRVYLEPAAQAKQPLFQRRLICGMDLQVNIFGFKT